MKYSTRLSDTIHMMAFIYINPKNDLSSNAIAVSIHTNPSYVRQLMMALRKANLLSSVHGHAKPELTKSPKEITLLEVYHAVEGNKPLLHLDTNTNPDCNVGVNIQFTLQEYYKEVQEAAECKMQKITLDDIIQGFYNKVGDQKLIWD